jgi:hypothetical protein
VALVRVGPVRIAISALAPFRPPGWGSVGCRTFVELNLSGALDARHHLGDGGSVSGGLCQLSGTTHAVNSSGEADSDWGRIGGMDVPGALGYERRGSSRLYSTLVLCLALIGTALAAPNVERARALDEYELSVGVDYDTGTGTVTGDIGRHVAGTSVSITATPTPNSSFEEWNSGPCAGGSTNPCTFEIQEDIYAAATFANSSEPQVFLTVNTDGEGYGSVSGPPEGYFGYNTQVTLTAVPDEETSIFTTWSSGPCTGSASPTCTFFLTEDTAISPTFDDFPYLSVNVQGSGIGQVTGTNSYLGSGHYPLGTVITLTASAVPFISQFVAWTGDVCDNSTATTCSFTISSDTLIDAEFNEIFHATDFAIDGTAQEEGTVYLSEAPSWSSPTTSLRYRWYRCTNPGGNAGQGPIPTDCTPIARATASEHVITSASVGYYLRLLVTGLSAEGIASVYSQDALGPVVPLNLELSQAPSYIYSDLIPGEYVSLNGDWNRNWWTPQVSSVTYRWYTCASRIELQNSAPEDCNPVSGTRGGGSDIQITSAEEGSFLGVLIRGTRGSAVATLFSTLAVQIPVSVKEEPEIFSSEFLLVSGDTIYEPGVSNYARANFYSNPELSPNTLNYFSYPRANSVQIDWYRCLTEGAASAAPNGCTWVAGGGFSSSLFDWSYRPVYYFTRSDAGHYIRARITISNGFGTDSLYTPTTELIMGPPDEAPSILTDPRVTQTPRASDPVNHTWGSWDAGFPEATLATAWYLCTLAGEASSSLPADCTLRVRGDEFTPSEADVGQRLRMRLDLTNSEGTVTSFSATSEPVFSYESSPPRPLDYPSFRLNGGQTEYVPGNTFESTGYWGRWHTSPRVLGQSYSWWLCDSRQFTGTDVGDCRLINTSRSGYGTYLIRSADVGKFIRRGWSAINRNGKTTMFSATSPRIRAAALYQPAKLLFYPRILDEPLVGTPLWQDGGAWMAYGGMPGYYARVKSYQIQWLACESAGDESREIPADCNVINEDQASGGETPGNEYTPQLGDAGYYLRVAITANSVGGPSTAVSATSVAVGEPDQVAPVPLEDPAVFLEEIGGTRYFTSEVAWDGYPVPTSSSLRWYRCTGTSGGVTLETPGTCAAISGATAFDYEVTAADVGKRLRVAFTATTSAGSTTVFSATSAAVPALPTQIPANVSVPLVSGIPMVSLRLVGSIGNWVGLPTNLTYTYRWFSCSSGGVASSSLPAGCSTLSATTLGYVPVSANRGKHLRLAVTANNGVGSTTHWSAATAAVASLANRAPVASGMPCVEPSDSDLVVGSSMNNGGCTVLWSAYPAVVGSSSSWWSCVSADSERTGSSAPTGCRRVQTNQPTAATSGVGALATGGGGEGDAYLTTTADLGRHLRLAMTATNRAGKATVWSATVGPFVEAPPETRTEPIIIFAPELYDTPEVGEWFWQDGGAWVEYGDTDYPPISNYNAEWLRCTTEGVDSETLPAGCVSATGQTAAADGARSAYLPTTSDVGWYLRVAVTARNAAGSTTWYSGTSPIVPEPPRYAPQLISEPYFESGLDAGEVYAGAGSWSAYPPISPIQFRWHRCTGDAGDATYEAPVGCSPIGSASVDSNWYRTVAADTGMRIRVEIIAINSEGQVTWFSQTSPIVPNLLPSNPGGAGAPTVSVTVGNSSSLSAWGGSWSGYEAPELTYAWYSCTSGGSDTPATLPINCSAISGASAATLLPQNLGGRYIRVGVTGTNSRGTATRFSTAFGPIVSAPTVTTSPAISGTARVGRQLTASTGTWTGSPTLSYQWFRCTRVGRDNPTRTPSGCTEISGATFSNYELSSSDARRFIRVRVTGTNISGTLIVFSQSTSAVSR